MWKSSSRLLNYHTSKSLTICFCMGKGGWFLELSEVQKFVLEIFHMVLTLDFFLNCNWNEASISVYITQQLWYLTIYFFRWLQFIHILMILSPHLILITQLIIGWQKEWIEVKSLWEFHYMDKVLLWLQEKTMDSIPKPMEVQVLENLQEQEDFYHTLRYFGVFQRFFYQVTPLLQLVLWKPKISWL